MKFPIKNSIKRTIYISITFIVLLIHSKDTDQKAVNRQAKESAQIPFNPPISVVTLRRKKSNKKTLRGSVEMKGQKISIHIINEEYTYSPIKDWLFEEVWNIINSIPCPWGFDNKRPFQIYSNASADDYECPTVVTNKDHASCGQSRFGCWVCTVVKEDKSMRALINIGFIWLITCTVRLL